MFVILEGIRNLARAKLTSFMVILVIGTALLVGGWFFIITLKLRESSDIFESAMEFEAFLQDTLSEESIDLLRSELESNPAVSSVHFISRDSAAAIFFKDTGEDIYTLTGENPLPPSFRIRFAPGVLIPENIDSVLASISSYRGVEDTIAQRELILTLLRYRRIIWITHIGAGIVICIIAFLLISNATKVSILSRKKSIEVMKLVGATNSFIKRPFLIEGLIEGFIGGILSSLLTLGFGVLFHIITKVTIPIPYVLIYYLIAAGSLLGIFGSNFAVRRYLKVLDFP